MEPKLLEMVSVVPMKVQWEDSEGNENTRMVLVDFYGEVLFDQEGEKIEDKDLIKVVVDRVHAQKQKALENMKDLPEDIRERIAQSQKILREQTNA